jgi:quinol monooxygenase YgiN
MDEPIHIAIVLRVRKSHIAEFERALADFAHRSLAEPGARGVQSLYPPPGSASTDYGIIRSFASPSERDAFYGSPLFKDWLTLIEPMVEGKSTPRQLSGLEAWFRDGAEPMPPRWKMALLTWPRGMALEHARADDRRAGARIERSSIRRGGVYHGWRGRDPDLDRDAFCRQGGASVASPENRRS